jgi:hypothetical protein
MNACNAELIIKMMKNTNLNREKILEETEHLERILSRRKKY